MHVDPSVRACVGGGTRHTLVFWRPVLAPNPRLNPPQFLRLLGAEREVLAFDNIGVGQTVDSSGEGLTVENMAASALELLEKLNLTQVGGG